MNKSELLEKIKELEHETSDIAFISYLQGFDKGMEQERKRWMEILQQYVSPDTAKLICDNIHGIQ